MKAAIVTIGIARIRQRMPPDHFPPRHTLGARRAPCGCYSADQRISIVALREETGQDADAADAIRW